MADKVSIEKVLAKAEEAPKKPPMIEISSERLAVDLLRCMLYTFRVRTVQISDSNLPENEYPSSTFLKELIRPAVFFSMILRDKLRDRFLKSTVLTEVDQRADDEVDAEGDDEAKDKDEAKDAEKSEDKTMKYKYEEKAMDVKVSETKDDDETEGEKAAGDDDETEGEKAAGDDDGTKGEKAAGSDDGTKGEKAAGDDDGTKGEKAVGDEDKAEDGKAAGDEDEAKAEGKGEDDGIAAERKKIETVLLGLFNHMYETASPDIYKQFLMTIVFCSELTQYLDSINKADLIEHIPGAWVTLFESKVRTEFQTAGYFEEYLSYWAILTKVEHHVYKYVKHFTPYEKESSQKFKGYLSSIDDFQEPEIVSKVLGFDVVSKLKVARSEYWKTVNLFGFYPHEKLTAMKPASEAAAEGDKSKSEASNTAGSDGSRSAKSAGARARKLKASPGQSYSRLVAQKKAERERRQRELDLDRLAD